MNVIVQMHLG